MPEGPERLGAALTLGEALLDRLPHGGRCTLTVNDNRRRALSWRKEGSSLKLSVHHQLLPHPQQVAAVVLMRDQDAWHELQQVLVLRPSEPSQPGPAQGSIHDLDQLLDQVIAGLDEPCEPPVIGWGNWPSRAPTRGLRLGSCSGDPPVLRIHPVLDSPDVPEWFVCFIVFHELLHVLVPPVRGPTGRRNVHSAAFLSKERAHPDHDRALSWEKANVPGLIKRTRLHVNGKRRGNHSPAHDILGGRSP